MFWNPKIDDQPQWIGLIQKCIRQIYHSVANKAVDIYPFHFLSQLFNPKLLKNVNN